jgi:hypothetical protein
MSSNNLLSSTPTVIGDLDISLFYANQPLERDPILSNFRYFLQFGSLMLEERIWTLFIKKGGFAKRIEVNNKGFRSALISVPSDGKYSINATSAPLIGHLEVEDSGPEFPVVNDWNLFESVRYIPLTPRSASLTQTPGRTTPEHQTNTEPNTLPESQTSVRSTPTPTESLTNMKTATPSVSRSSPIPPALRSGAISGISFTAVTVPGIIIFVSYLCCLRNRETNQSTRDASEDASQHSIDATYFTGWGGQFKHSQRGNVDDVQHQSIII